MSAPPPHDVGIDTRGLLKDLPWPKILAWRQPTVNVTFAGRYFFPIPDHPTWGHVWEKGETAGLRVKGGLNPELGYVFPLQGPGAKPYNRIQGLDDNGSPVAAAKVRSWGTQDARTICKRISDVVDSGELQFPSPSHVIVYLDVEASDPGEPKLTLSSDYWFAWATNIFFYSSPGLQSAFYPGIYCATMHNSSARGDPLLHRVPASADYQYQDVQTGLTARPNTLSSICYGIYASNPLVPGRYKNNFSPDWGSPPNERFDAWQQAVKIGPLTWRSTVPVRLWQYVALVDGSTNPDIQKFNELNVDFDETSDGDAVNWMLIIPAPPPQG